MNITSGEVRGGYRPGFHKGDPQVDMDISSAEERLKVKSAHLANVAPEMIQMLDTQWKLTRLRRFRGPLLTGGTGVVVAGLVVALAGASALGVAVGLLGAGAIVFALSLHSISEGRTRKLLILEAALARSVKEGDKIGGPEVDWQEWRTSANNEEVLGAKGHAVGSALVTAAMGATNQLQQTLLASQLGGMTNEEIHGVTLEMEWWLIHAIDRISFNVLDEVKRNAFIQGLLLAVPGRAWGVAEATIGIIGFKEFEQMFLKGAEERSSRYTRCFMAEVASDVWKDGELDYELFKRANGILGNRLHKLQVRSVSRILTDCITYLKVKDLLKMGEF